MTTVTSPSFGRGQAQPLPPDRKSDMATVRPLPLDTGKRSPFHLTARAA